MKITTVRVAVSIHDALLRFAQSQPQQLSMSDAIAELLTRCGEKVVNDVVKQVPGPTPKYLGK
jgi:hypothetical protein